MPEVTTSGLTKAKGVIGDPTRTPEETRTLSITFETYNRGFVLDMKDIEIFWFIEDIFTHSMTGVLRFRDTVGFAEFAPITGSDESLHLTYGQDNDINLTFDVYKVREIVQTGGADTASQNVIEVHFVDDMFQLLTQQKWSRSFVDESVSDIVRHLANNMLQKYSFNKFEASSEKIDFVMPYWTVRQAFKWLLKRGTSTTTGTPGYIFFQNTKGLNFITLESLLQGAPRIGTPTSGVYKFEEPDKPYFRTRILGWKIQGVDNFTMNFSRGGNNYGFDFDTKTFIRNQYEFLDGLDQTTVLGRKALFTDIGTSRARYELEGDTDTKILDAIFYSDFIKRYSMQQAVKLVMKGHEDRFAGDMIEIEWPSTEKGLVHNKQMKGIYLVKSVTNQWSASRPSWVQKLVCLKNGYTDSRNLNLTLASKRNIYGTTGGIGILGRLLG